MVKMGAQIERTVAKFDPIGIGLSCWGALRTTLVWKTPAKISKSSVTPAMPTNINIHLPALLNRKTQFRNTIVFGDLSTLIVPSSKLFVNGILRLAKWNSPIGLVQNGKNHYKNKVGMLSSLWVQWTSETESESWNSQVEQHLHASSLRRQIATLRRIGWYQWTCDRRFSEPTLYKHQH